MMANFLRGKKKSGPPAYANHLIAKIDVGVMFNRIPCSRSRSRKAILAFTQDIADPQTGYCRIIVSWIFRIFDCKVALRLLSVPH